MIFFSFTLTVFYSDIFLNHLDLFALFEIPQIFVFKVLKILIKISIRGLDLDVCCQEPK